LLIVLFEAYYNYFFIIHGSKPTGVKIMQAVLQNLEATFEGKESEHNWSKRHEACRDVIPTLCKSEAAKEQPARLAAGIRHIIDGLMGCAKSERTQLSNEACKALQEVAKALGPTINPMLDIILPPLIDVCGFTKPVSQKNGSEAFETIVRNAGYHTRILHYITSTSSDKRKPPRVAAAKWLRVFIATYHHDVEKVSANLDTIERALTTGLGDTQKDVRETMRAAYWTFSKYWSARAEALMRTLPKAAQTALVADKHNPNQRAPTPSAPVASKKTISEQTRAFILAKKQKLAQESAAAASEPTAAPRDTPVDTVQNSIAKPRETVIEDEHSASTVIPTEPQRMPSGLLAEPARRRIVAVSTAKPTITSRPASALPHITTAQSDSTPHSRPTSAASAMPPPPATTSFSRPVSVASTAAMSHASSATVKAASRKPLISKERLHDIMTKPLEGADENNKENTRAHGLLDKREWARKETAEVSQRSIKPITKDPAAARRLISRGIKGISEHTIDDVGYRRLQGVIKEHDNIFIDEPKYDDMLLSLFTAIEQPDIEERRPLGRKNDSIFQMLVVLRLMLQHNQKYLAGYYPRAITALITARANFQARCHIVSGFEQTVEDIVKVCQPSDVIDAVLMTLELAGKPIIDLGTGSEAQDEFDQDLLNEQSARSTAFGLHILSGLITRVQQTDTELDTVQEQRMATLGMNCLRSTNVTVKRAVMEYCVKLHEIIEPESRFYKLLTDGVADLENLIEYYVIASKAGAITTEGRGIVMTEGRSIDRAGKGISTV
jgi:hypothetical protein